ncbi:MAG: DUF4913 domain-containing protein [Corynebacterium sp.]|nr:DUF4913 domain-containing protein [Corynebacterium sp.]
MKKHIEHIVQQELLENFGKNLHKGVSEVLDELENNDQIKPAFESRGREQASECARKLLEKPETHFATVYEFVDEFLVHMYPYPESRRSAVRWTGKWWAHPEAVARLSALWYRFEQLKKDEPATYLETFLRVHADYHMSVLMKEGGPFDAARYDEKSIPLPSDPISTTHEEQ